MWCNKDKIKCSFAVFCQILQENPWMQLLCPNSELCQRKIEKSRIQYGQNHPETEEVSKDCNTTRTQLSRG